MPDGTNITQFPGGDMNEGLIDVEDLFRIIEAFEGHKDEMDTQRGHIGALIKDGEETHGLHRAAFKLAVKLRNESSEKRADFLRAFDYYRKVLNFDAQQELPLDGAG